MASPEPEVKYKTYCRLCQKEWLLSPLDLPNPAKPDIRMAKFGLMLWSHLEKEHAEMSRLLALICAFRPEDPVLVASMNYVRAHAHRSTIANYLSDPQIHDAVSRLELTLESVEAFAKDLRDFVTETGKYSPPQGEQQQQSVVLAR